MISISNSNMWHKTMVYFGLVEDGLDDNEDFDEEEEHLAAHRELEESYKERPNVRKISRSARKRRVDYDDIYPEENSPRKVSRVRPLRAAASPVNVSVHLVLPKNFNDAQQVADKFKADIPVILNMQNADTDLAKRLIDFSSGLTYALDGGMQRVADKVFLLTPRNVDVSAEERARLMEKGFFNQS
ncbi:MAG: cell division protein SepF [Actinobacteria bacterium]|nr:cell division protein SepF [Actinomycetota bacterium]